MTQGCAGGPRWLNMHVQRGPSQMLRQCFGFSMKHMQLNFEGKALASLDKAYYAARRLGKRTELDLHRCSKHAKMLAACC